MTAPLAALAAVLLFHFADARIDEASGIAPGHVQPGVVWVQNDSGGGNRFFGVDGRTGRTVATVTVPGVTNVDWEDIATAQGSIWLADIGDNTASRREIDVYRVTEPSGRGNLTATGLRTWRLRYPDGAHDAEGFAVDPRGVGYLVTKSPFGASTVYRIPAQPSARRVQTVTRVAGIQVSATGTPGPFGIVGELLVTGAAFSADGSLFAVRTYTDAYVWRVDGSVDGSFTATLARAPVRVALPRQPQGEGIAISGHRGADRPAPQAGRMTAMSMTVPSADATVLPSAAELAAKHPVLALTLWIVGGVIVLSIGAAFIGRALIRRGMREPFVVRLINRASDRIVDTVKRPITIAVLDEVADVLRTGHYTRNLASALQENREEIKDMVAEKIKEDPSAGAISLVPFHERIIERASETTIRVILEVLADPRTDELVSDLLRDNITQIRAAVRERQEG